MSNDDQPAVRTQALAEFTVGTRFENIPEDVRARTHVMVRDGTGALLAASNPAYSTGRIIADFVRDQGGPDEATVIGFGFRTGAVHAALANGTMGYACDFEPHHPSGILHPIAIMTPAALAVAESVDASGARFLAAVAIGCEVEYRVSMAIGPAEQYALGFHPSAVCGCFGATAAAASLLGLEPEACVRAFGLAACQASGLMAWETDPTENARPFQMGMAARNGLTAAFLAKDGFGGPDAVFDHGHTVYKAFSRNPSPDKLTDGLGTVWDGMMMLAIKPYSAVSFLHPALDALLGIMTDEGLSADDVDTITMHFPRSGVHCVDGNPLKSHCAQYILPVAAVRGAVTPDVIFEDLRETDARIGELSRRVTVVPDDGELEANFPRVYDTIMKVGTRDGRTFERRNEIARGYPQTPLSDGELDAKFTMLTATVASAERVAALKDCITGLPDAPNVSEFAALLGRPAGT